MTCDAGLVPVAALRLHILHQPCVQNMRCITLVSFRNLLTLKKTAAPKQQVVALAQLQTSPALHRDHVRVLLCASDCILQSVVAQLDPKGTGWVTVESLASYFVSECCVMMCCTTPLLLRVCLSCELGA